jgi:mRNA-degrading endonuclease RelE of RelBE toxin-antitoxin system
MKCEVRVTANFEKAVKPLLKKYMSLKQDLIALETKLIGNPRTGTPLGKQVYKIRLSITSKGKGKSGGARVITYLEVEATFDEETTTVYLLTIYDKSKVSTISSKEINKLIKESKK